MIDDAEQKFATRVLEGWCLGTEDMEGDQWTLMCRLAGVDPVAFAERAMQLRSSMTPTERRSRLAKIARDRSTAALKDNEPVLDGPIVPGAQRHTRKMIWNDD